MLPAGWRQEGHPATEKLCLKPSFSWIFMDDNKNWRSTARSTSWATQSTYQKQNDGEPGQTAGRSSRHYEGHRTDTLQGSQWVGWKNTSNVPDRIRIATSNTGTMLGRSAEVVETLHRRKIDVCCTITITISFIKIL